MDPLLAEIVVGIITVLASGGAVLSLITVRRQARKLDVETESVAVRSMRESLEVANKAAADAQQKIDLQAASLEECHRLHIEQAGKISAQAAEIRRLSSRVQYLEKNSNGGPHA